MEGIVKWFNTRKGFGFVKGDDDEDYFVHYTALEKNVFLRDNDKVSFDPVETDKGKQAQNVKLLQKGSEMEGSGDQPQEEAPVEEQSEETQIEEQPQEDSESFGEEEKKE